MSDTLYIEYDFDPRNLPPELLQAIGFMTVASSQNEHLVQEMIGALLGIDNIETPALTAHMSAPLKDQIVRALVELNIPDTKVIDDLDDLLDTVKRASDDRNTAVHNSICRNPNTGETFSMRQKARGSLQIELQPISALEIEKQALAVYEAGIDVARFMILYGLWPRARVRPTPKPVDRRNAARKLRKNAAV